MLSGGGGGGGGRRKRYFKVLACIRLEKGGRGAGGGDVFEKLDGIPQKWFTLFFLRTSKKKISGWEEIEIATNKLTTISLNIGYS